MTEREALLAAICDNPDEDTPRLVYADWLDENGEPERAEFIRVQIEAERIGLNNAVGERLFFRERELLCEHESSWRTELPIPFLDHPFVRGFVESATFDCDSRISVSAVAGLFEASPLVDLTFFNLADPGVLAAVPAMARLRTLCIGLSEPDQTSLELFLTKTSLGALKSLRVFHSWNIMPRRSVSGALENRLRERFKHVFVNEPHD